MYINIHPYVHSVGPANETNYRNMAGHRLWGLRPPFIEVRGIKILPPVPKWAELYAYTPQCTSIRGLVDSIRWYLGYLKGQSGGGGGGCWCILLVPKP